MPEPWEMEAWQHCPSRTIYELRFDEVDEDLGFSALGVLPTEPMCGSAVAMDHDGEAVPVSFCLGYELASEEDVAVEDHGVEGDELCPPGVWMRVPVRYTSTVEVWGAAVEQTHAVDLAISGERFDEWAGVQWVNPDEDSEEPVYDEDFVVAAEEAHSTSGDLVGVQLGPTTRPTEVWADTISKATLTVRFTGDGAHPSATVLTWSAQPTSSAE